MAACRAPILGLVALVAAAGCDGEVRKRAKKLARQGDAPPVVYVEREVRGVSNLMAEVEPNDEAGAAMPITPPGGARAVLATEEDLDHYRVAIAEGGMLAVQVSGIEDIDLKVDVVAEGQVIFRSDRGGEGVPEGIPNMPVTKGKPVIIQVSQFLSTSDKRRRKKKPELIRTKPTKPYELSAVLITEPGEDREVEPNSQSSGARELLLGEGGRGYLGWNQDRDLWRVSLLGFSAGYSLDVDAGGVPGVKMKLEVLDDDGAVIATREGTEGQSLFVRNLEPARKGKAPEHYSVRISGSRSNPLQEYTVRATSRRLEPGEEIEPNDSADTASPVAEEGASRGQARGYIGAGDRDVLVLPPPSEPSVANLTLSASPSANLAMAVKQRGRVLAEADAGDSGVGEKLIGVPVDAGSPVILVITGTVTGDAASAYRIDWDYALGDGFTDLPPEE